jgi:RimJ/RimL family protein N-acetyltransferase
MGAVRTMAKRILAGADELVAEWITQRIPDSCFGATPYVAIGLVNEVGAIIAGALYDEYRRVDIFAHLAAVPGRRWMTREFLGEIFRYPFQQLGCTRITSPVAASNADCIRFVEHLGFQLEGRLRKRTSGGGDLLIYGMLREECRHLKTGIKPWRASVPRFDACEHIRCAI